VIKVLHIVESFDGQAIEKWLTLLVSESVKRGNGVNWTFYCIEKNAGRYSEQLTKLGCEVIYSAYPISMTVKFMKALRATIRTGGYDIIHSHHDLMSAVYFLATLGLPVRKRIMHIHNTSLSLPTNSKWKQFFGKEVFRLLCYKFSDHIVGVSDSALKSFLNGKSKNEKCSIIHCAIDAHSLTDENLNYLPLRVQLGIPDNALILLFVGRMIAYKNPAFVLEILAVLWQTNEDVYGVFAGEGDEIQVLSDLADINGMGDRVKCLGWRNDVRELMAISDVLVFPSHESHMEGLGLSVVEAQSVGLPVVMSLSVPDEAIVISELIVKIPLNLGAKEWGNRFGKTLPCSRRGS
jgi:glycosyltransferase involved in cell wall biosynthesis